MAASTLRMVGRQQQPETQITDRQEAVDAWSLSSNLLSMDVFLSLSFSKPAESPRDLPFSTSYQGIFWLKMV